MGKSIEKCDRTCLLCSGKMDEIWGDISGQSSYYYDECPRCGIRSRSYSYMDGVITYYVRDIIDAIKDLTRDQEIEMRERNRWNKNYKCLVPYLELFK